MLQKCPGRPSQVGNCAVGHILYIRVAKTDFSPVILEAPGRQPLALSVAAICRIVIFPVPDCVRAPGPGLGRLRRAGSPPIQGDKIGKQFGIALSCLVHLVIQIAIDGKHRHFPAIFLQLRLEGGEGAVPGRQRRKQLGMAGAIPAGGRRPVGKSGEI